MCTFKLWSVTSNYVTLFYVPTYEGFFKRMYSICDRFDILGNHGINIGNELFCCHVVSGK